ncbi:MAG: D-glycerate dehydrogenase [Rickettsiales bacterium]|nr:D-glycerate dehydrogenase [Rickettsiales bacterium]|tara:strand:+ start:1710 stop:2699 length:990 start_codon:yes stop_codon:yes gene_type:complete
MNLKKIKILLTRKLPDEIETKLLKKFSVVINKNDKKLSYTELKKRVADIDVLVPCISDTIDASIIKAAKNLKLIANFGNGVDNLDLVTANEKKILVTNTPDVLTEDTADLVLTMILMISRRIVLAQEKLMSGNWNGWGPSETLGEKLSGKKIGIIGMGRIGKAVALRCKSCGIKINYHNRNRLNKLEESHFEAKFWENLDAMLCHVDIISIHCPYTPETFHLLSKKRLLRLKKNSIIINTSRGEIIDETELARLLIKQKIAGAGLDVFEHEPQITQELLDAKNVVLLPHISSATKESRISMGDRVITNIESFSSGRRPPDIVSVNNLII